MAILLPIEAIIALYLLGVTLLVGAVFAGSAVNRSRKSGTNRRHGDIDP